MAFRRTKVGETYVTVEYDVDDSGLAGIQRSFDRVSKAAQKTFGDDFQANIRSSLAETDRQFTTTANKNIQAWQKLEAQRQKAAKELEDRMRKHNADFEASEKQKQKAVDQTAARLRKMYDDIDKETRSKVKFEDHFADEGDRAGKAYADHVNKHFERMTTVMRETFSKAQDRIDEDDHNRWRGRFHRWGDNFTRGFDSALSLLPGRMEALFSGRGGPIGLAIGGAIITGILAALPALGAMLSGATFLTIGLAGAIAAAFVAAADDKRVLEAAHTIANTFKRRIIYDPDMQNLGQVLADQLYKVNKALNDWAPSINSILQAGAKFLGPITDGAIEFLNALLPPLDRLMNSQFMMDLFNIAAQGMKKIGEAFSVSFDRFLSDPAAMEGAKKGLEDIFNLLAGGIKTIFDWMRKLSAVWHEWTTDPDGPGPLVSKLDRMRQIWEDIKTAVDDLGDELSSVFGPGSDFDNAFNVMKSFREDFGDLGILWEGINGRQKGIPTMSGERDFNADAPGLGSANPDDFWKNQWEDFVAETKVAWNTSKGKIEDYIKNNPLSLMGALNQDWGMVFITAVEAFKGYYSDLWNIAKEWTPKLLGIAQQYYSDLWNIAQQSASTLWGVAVGYYTGIWNIGSQYYTALLELAGRYYQGLWNTVVGIFNAIISYMVSYYQFLISLAIQYYTGLWNTIVNIWNGILAYFLSIWNRFLEIAMTFWNAINTFLNNGMSVFSQAWGAMWDGLVTAFWGVWEQIGGAAAAGMNSVLGVVNNGIDIINAVLGKLNIGFSIEKLGLVSAPARQATGRKGENGGPGFAQGGRLFGPGTPTSDSFTIRASRDEFMMREWASKRIGYQNLDYMNRTGMLPPGFAAGGRVGGGNEGLMQQHMDHLHVAMSAGYQAVIAAAAASGIPFKVTSTVRPGSRGSSGGFDHHHGGLAVDFGGENQDALASYFQGLEGVIELIHRTTSGDYAIFGGKGGGVGGFLNQFLAKGIDWVMDHMVGPALDQASGLLPNNAMGAIGKGMFKGMRSGLRTKIEETMKRFREMASVGGGGLAGAQQWAGTASQALAMLGLPDSWLGPLLTLIGRESGGNPNAINNWDSNARMGMPSQGLMQTIPSTFLAYRVPGYDNILDPLSNILAGLRYIMSRYGSIFNVQQAVGSSPRGYKNGGWAAPGWNFMHEPELMLNSAQGRALENRIAGDGVETAELHFHFHGITRITEQEAKDIAIKVRNELSKHAGRNGGKTGL